MKLLKVYFPIEFVQMLHCLKIASCSAQTQAGCQRLDTRGIPVISKKEHCGCRLYTLPLLYTLPSVYSCIILYTLPHLPYTYYTYLYTLPLCLCPKSIYSSILSFIVYFLFFPAPSVQLNTLKAFMPPSIYSLQ